jgi:hypothetical protein
MYIVLQSDQRKIFVNALLQNWVFRPSLVRKPGFRPYGKSACLLLLPLVYGLKVCLLLDNFVSRHK